MLLLLVILVVVLVLYVVFLYGTGPGRRLRHKLIYLQFRKHWQSGRAPVNLRVVDGAQVGLRGRGWLAGVAVVSPGRLDYVRWIGGVPLVKRPIPAIQVIAVGAAGPAVGLAKLKLMDPDYQVAMLRTPTAILEIAVVPPVPAEEVLARLRAPGMPAF